MTTPLLSLPELAASQAQPHIPHNEALRTIEAAMNITVIAQQNAPPVSPVEGDRYLVGTAGTGAWAGQDNKVACYSGGAWIYLMPDSGWLAYNKATATLLIYGTSSPADWETLTTGGGGTAMYGAKAERFTNTQSIPDLTDTDIVFDTEVFDTGGFCNLGTDNDALTITAAGRYLVEGYAQFAANATGVRMMYFMKNTTDLLNGVMQVDAATDVTTLHFTAIANLALNDVIQLRVYQDSGGALNILNNALGWQAYLALHRIG